MYYSDNGNYPQIGAGGGITFSDPNFYNLLSNYLSPLPSDPLGNTWNEYDYIIPDVNPANSYGIRVRFETIHQNSYEFGNPSYGGGWCLTGANVHYTWFGPIDQCSTIPHV